MSDVTVALGVSGKETVLGAFSQVGQAGKQMGETFGSIAGKLAGLAAGYVSITGVVNAFNSVMEKGGQLSDFSDQTGIAVDKLVILGRAFENNGMKAEDLGGIVNKMQKQIAAAGVEGSEAADKINKLGLRVSDLQGMDPDKQFEVIGKAIAGIKDPTERAAAAMEIFGKSGGRVLAFLSDFDGNLAQANREVGSYAEEMAKNARAFDSIGDGIAAIGQKATEFTAGLVDGAAPALQTLVDYFKAVDATDFGKSFSQSLSRGIDIALSVFTNPGNLFLAFGDALVVTFKTAGNYLLSGLQFALEWAIKYATEILPNFSELVKATFTATFGGVISFFSEKLSSVFTEMASILPEKWAGPIRDYAKKLSEQSEDWGTAGSVALAKAWEGISTAAEKVTKETSFQYQDYFNAEASMASLSEHVQVAAESGAAVRNDMQETLDNARLITEEAQAWDQATDRLAKNFAGAAETFKEFSMRGPLDPESSGLSEISGLPVPERIGPVASKDDLRSVSSNNRIERATTLRQGSSRGGASSGFDPNHLLSKEDQSWQSAPGMMPLPKMSQSQLDIRLDTRAQQSVQKDLSFYTGGAENASRAQAIDDLFRKYQQDIGGNPSELRRKAEADFEDLVNKKKGPDGGMAPGYDNRPSRREGQPDKPSDPISAVADSVKQILNHIKSSLPQHALSA